jgi:cold-inducible RNA-binding protein
VILVANKLYVGNLPYTVTSDTLKTHFAAAGAVIDAVVISDSRTGRSKGFGFVEYGKDEEAKKAIEMFNGKDMEGRNLVVNEARPKKEEGQV